MNNTKNLNNHVHLSDLLVSNLGEFVDGFFQDNRTTTTQRFKPQLTVSENDNGFKIDVAIPGFAKEDVTIEIDNEFLSISGKKEKKNSDADVKYHLREIKEGEFFRKLRLPKNADSAKVKATAINGILSLDIPKREETKPKKITIK